MGWHSFLNIYSKEKKNYSRKKLMKRGFSCAGRQRSILSKRPSSCLLVKLISHDVTYSSVHICDLFPVYVKKTTNDKYVYVRTCVCVFARLRFFHAVRKQRLRWKGKKKAELWKNPKKNIGCSKEKEKEEQSCTLSLAVVVSLPRRSSLNRLLRINRTPLHWFSPRAHHARVSQCRNRDVSPPYRSTYNANILSFLLPVEQPILFVRFERDDELYRRRKRKRREEICQLDGDLFVSKISTRIVIVSYRNARNIQGRGEAMVDDESDEYFKSKLRISIKLGKKKFTTLLKRRWNGRKKRNIQKMK